MPKIKLDKLKVSNAGVSQTIGTILLLAIAVVIFSAFMVYILSNPVTPSPPHANLAGSMEVTTAIIEHKGGESWELDDSKIIVRLGNVEEVIVNFTNGNSSNSSVRLVDVNKNGRWDIGDSLEIDCDGLFGRNTSDWQIEVMIIDLPSNSIIMDSILQTGKLHEPDTDPPTADFTIEPPTPSTADTVYFNSTSTDSDGTIVSWEWEFGDGSTGSGENVTHQYADNGTYQVNLTVTDNDGATDTFSINITILNVSPTADFTWAPTDPDTSDTIQFTDLSTDSDGYIVSWSWDFGDGTVLYEQNPSHQYSYNDTFTVTLTVKDDDGDTNTTSKDVTVLNIPPTASFTYTYGEYAVFNNPDGNGLNFSHMYIDENNKNHDSRSGILVDTNYIWLCSHHNGLWRASKYDYGDYGDVSGDDASLWGIYRSGNYIYGVSGESKHSDGKHLYIYNYTSGEVVGDIVTQEAEAYGVYVTGDYAYIASDAGLEIYNVGTPSNPSYERTVQTGLDFIKVSGAGDYVYATAYSDDTLRIFDISSDGSNPSLVGTYDPAAEGNPGFTGDIRGLYVDSSNNLVYFVNNYADLYIVDVSNPADPDDVGNITLPGGEDDGCEKPGGDVFVIGNSAFVVAAKKHGKPGYLHWINVSNKNNPHLVNTTCDTSYGYLSVYVYGGCVYAGSHDGVFRYCTGGHGGEGYEIHFTDESIDTDGNITEWHWDFGDGNISYEQNPTHIYAAAGIYNVTLTVTDDAGDFSSTTMAVSVGFPVADFSYDPDPPVAHDSVDFTDLSTSYPSDIVSWGWDFGDGNPSNEQNPSNTYATIGSYNVTLIVLNSDGFEDSTTKTITVERRTIWVDDNFIDDPLNHKWNTIDKGIADALDDDIIYVYNGTYDYSGINALDVNKVVDIMGESRDSVIIQGTGDHPIILFSSDGATLKNATLRKKASVPTYAIEVYSENVIIEYCNFTDLRDAILFGNDAANTTFRYNNLWDIEQQAIIILNSENNNILENNIWQASDGFYIDGTGSINNHIQNNTISECKNGIYFDGASNNVASYNHISYCSLVGIHFTSSSNNNLTHNNITHNLIAINIIQYSNENSFSYNDISANNSEMGTYLIEIPNNGPSPLQQSNDNIFHHNNVRVLDDPQPGSPLAFDYYTNIWNTTDTGNYWSNYDGTDSEPDGIGDTPYNIDGGQKDYYPLMNPVTV